MFLYSAFLTSLVELKLVKTVIKLSYLILKYS